MEYEINTWLADIKQAIIEINQFLPDKKNFLEFLKLTLCWTISIF